MLSYLWAVLVALSCVEGKMGFLRGHGNVAAVQHGGPAVEGVGVEGHVVATATNGSAGLSEGLLGNTN